MPRRQAVAGLNSSQRRLLAPRVRATARGRDKRRAARRARCLVRRNRHVVVRIAGAIRLAEDGNRPQSRVADGKDERSSVPFGIFVEHRHAIHRPAVGVVPRGPGIGGAVQDEIRSGQRARTPGWSRSNRVRTSLSPIIRIHTSRDSWSGTRHPAGGSFGAARIGHLDPLAEDRCAGRILGEPAVKEQAGLVGQIRPGVRKQVSGRRKGPVNARGAESGKFVSGRPKGGRGPFRRPECVRRLRGARPGVRVRR